MNRIDFILNMCLNDALCGCDRIKRFNSNEIAGFVTNWLEVHKTTIQNIESTEGVSAVTSESGDLHDVVLCTDHGSETETAVEKPLSSTPETERLDVAIELDKIIDKIYSEIILLEALRDAIQPKGS